MIRKLSYLAGKILAAHEYQGASNDCGPYCLAMIGAATDRSAIHGRELAAQFNKPIWHAFLPEFRRIKDWATFPWAVSSMLRGWGFNARWSLMTQTYHLIEGIDSVCPPIVIIGGWKPLWAHYMILLSYDPIRGFGFADPGYPHNELHWYAQPKFLERWKAFGQMAILTSST